MKFRQRQNRSSNDRWLLFFWIANLLLWIVFFTIVCAKDEGDYEIHNNIAILMINGEYRSFYPGYNLLVGGLWKLSGLPMAIAAGIVLGAAQTITIGFTRKLLELLLPRDLMEQRPLGTALLALAVCTMIPVFFGGMSPGYSCSNSYTSPSQIVNKPFIVATIYYWYLCEKEGEDRKSLRVNQVKRTVALILSCFTKPVFAMAFVVAAGIYYLLKAISEVVRANKSYDRKSSARKALIWWLRCFWDGVWPEFVTGLFLLVQYAYGVYLQDEMTLQYDSIAIKFGWMHTWDQMVDNVWLSLLLAYLFPLSYLCLRPGRVKAFVLGKTKEKNLFWKMSLIYGVVSFFMMSCLYQEGSGEAGANFRNAWIYTFTFVHTASVCGLARDLRESKDWKKPANLIPLLALLLQIGFGVVLLAYKLYFYLVFKTRLIWIVK